MAQHLKSLVLSIAIGSTLMPLYIGFAHAQGMYVDKGEQLVYHAYFRRVDTEDPGTAHLFMANLSEQPIRVEKFRFNGYEMTDMPNDWAIWWQAVPCIAKPQEVMNVMVKLRRPTRKPVRVTAILSNGQEVSVALDPKPPDLKFGFIGYSNELDRVYLYLENTGSDDIVLDRIFCNTSDITEECFIPEQVVKPAQKVFVVFSPKAELSPGRYLAFKAMSGDGTTAVAISRVYSYFPITALHGDSRASLGFDQIPFEIKYPGNPAALKNYAIEPVHKAYHLLEDPACSDGYAYQLIGTHAKEILQRAATCYESDPVHPGLIYSCEHFKPYSYYIYGETADIFVPCPYEMHFHHEQPLKDAEYVAYAKKASEPRLLWTIPQAFSERKPPRYPTPEEERIIVYSEIGEGSKGIWYCTDNPKYGYVNDPPLEAEIGRINRELRVLKEYLVIGEPFPLATASIDKVKTYSLQCGDRGIALLLINTDHLSRFGEKESPFTYVPKVNFQVTCRITPGLKVTGAYAIEDGKSVPMRYRIVEQHAEITVPDLQITRQILISTERVSDAK